jgi:hypothetical protein
MMGLKISVEMCTENLTFMKDPWKALEGTNRPITFLSL